MPKKPKPAFQMFIENGFCKTPKEFAKAIREVARTIEDSLGVASLGTVYNKNGDGCGSFLFEPRED